MTVQSAKKTANERLEKFGDYKRQLNGFQTNVVHRQGAHRGYQPDGLEDRHSRRVSPD